LTRGYCASFTALFALAADEMEKKKELPLLFPSLLDYECSGFTATKKPLFDGQKCCLNLIILVFASSSREESRYSFSLLFKAENEKRRAPICRASCERELVQYLSFMALSRSEEACAGKN
jgi:hypothetical protein